MEKCNQHDTGVEGINKAQPSFEEGWGNSKPAKGGQVAMLCDTEQGSTGQDCDGDTTKSVAKIEMVSLASEG